MTSKITSTPTPVKTYSGNCHCGLVRFTITLPGSIYEQEVASCNCSLCTRYGSLFLYFPKKEVKYFSGERELKGYSASFGAKVVEHKFCPQCGSYTGWQRLRPTNNPAVEGVNVRMLNDVDVSKLKLKPLDQLGGYKVGQWYEEKGK